MPIEKRLRLDKAKRAHRKSGLGPWDEHLEMWTTNGIAHVETDRRGVQWLIMHPFGEKPDG